MENNIVQTNSIEAALIQGDLSKLSPDQRLSYYKTVCESLGLNQLTKPFEYINLNGKLTLYAKRDATDQLRKINKVSITIKNRELVGDIYVVTANAKDKDGREDESTGAVSIIGLKGDAMANAYMKAETKAKRRVTLSVCGLGLLDETEIETIKETKEPDQKSVEEDYNEAMQQEALSHDPGLYVPKIGKFKGKQLKELGVHELNNYVNYLKDASKSQNKPLYGDGLELVEFAEIYFKTKESSYIKQLS